MTRTDHSTMHQSCTNISQPAEANPIVIPQLTFAGELPTELTSRLRLPTHSTESHPPKPRTDLLPAMRHPSEHDVPTPPSSKPQTWTTGFTGSSSSSTSVSPATTTDNKTTPAGPSPSFTDAIKTVRPDHILSVHRQPCARQGFMTGLAGGAVVGAVRFVLGAPVARATNWAVGAGLLAAVGRYELCRYQRRVEGGRMMRVMEVMSLSEAKKKSEEEARARKAEAEREERRSWYKFW